MNESETASLSEKMDRKRAGRLATMPESCQGPFKRSYARKASPRTAIKAFCLECVGFDRVAVAECAAYACPLWNYRPFQPKEKAQ